MDSTTPHPPPDGTDALPVARGKHSRWLGLVWAVPLAALIIVAFLGIRSLAHRGVDVVVTFDDATGVKVGDTKVIYQGLVGGEVTKIEISEDGKHVDMTLRLDPRIKPYLNTATRFWLVGAKPNLTDIASVRAALAGLEIGVSPAKGGTPTTHFVGANEPPAVAAGTPGTAYSLTTSTLGAARAGTLLFYRGKEIGKATAVDYTEQDAFRIDVFVNAPFDKLIRPEALFWVSSPLRVSFNDRGVSADLEHPSALLNGSIDVDLPADQPTGAQSPANTVFPLYPSHDGARAGPTGPEIDYAFRFAGPAGDLSPGAQVRFLGFPIGVVKSVQLELDDASGVARTRVLAAIYPLKLRIKGPAAENDRAGWRAATDAVIRHLVARGYRAQLTQRPAVIGGLVIGFDAVKGAGPATLLAGNPMVIPTLESSSGIEEITGQVSQLLAKVDRLPIDAIGRDLRQLIAKVGTLVSSPDVTDSLKHLNSTLTQLDQMVTEVKPQVGPLVRKLEQTADQLNGTAAAARSALSGDGAAQDASVPDAISQLTEAARSIRSLADELRRHPESLIRGKGKEQ